MLAEIYHAAAQHGITAREIDATPLWKVGAMLRGPKSAEDDMLDVFAARLRGEEVEPRAMGMAQVIPLLNSASRKMPDA